MKMPAHYSISIAATMVLLAHFPAWGEDTVRPDDDPRVTPMVKLVRRCLPALVSVRVERETKKPNVVEFGHGGGSVIHADGYILTNNHVVVGAKKVEIAFFQGAWQRARVIARSPSEDLALLKVDCDEPLSALPLGRSNDLELGEPVITLGSPGGLPHSLSTGLISGLGRATNTEHAHLPSMVQTTAAISGGSSGGALINALGEQIGVITSRKQDGENLGFAITVDRVREAFPQLLAAEARTGIVHGLEVDMLDKRAVITSVANDSPAAKAGFQVGDVITAVAGKSVHSGVDFHLALVERQPGESLPLNVTRAEKDLRLSLVLGEVVAIVSVKLDDLQPGLRVARYAGAWDRLPDFDKLEPEETKITDTSPRTSDDMERDQYGERFSGYVKIPSDGDYFFKTRSDDGSRLWIGDRLVVDNDGLHAEAEVAGIVRLGAGVYPLRIDYFESAGDQSLQVLVESPNGKRRELPADWLFHRP